MVDINNPQTFAEWYWRNSVDARDAIEERLEKTLAPVLNNLFAGIPLRDALPDHVNQYFAIMGQPTERGFFDAIGRTLAQFGASVVNRITGNQMRDFDYRFNSEFMTLRITESIANLLYSRRKITEELWVSRNKSSGYSEEEMRFAYDAQKPYPNIAEIIQYARYNGPPDSPKELAWKLYDISENDWPLWEWLSRQKLTTEQVLSLHRQGYMTDEEATLEIMRLGWLEDDRQKLYNLAWETPNAMLALQGGLFRGLTDNKLTDVVSKAGIHPAWATTYIDGVLTKPSSTDIVAYQLRTDPTLSNLSTELKRIGIHPAYHPMYKELAYQIPPVQDIITMAVREAFTPAIAARFGQYEGLPIEFVEWAQKKGLSREWAERYWAAHWSLPSPQQGFEMLHRGIISSDDLSLLLRALDIMPFWRDRLIQMSYTPLTRVDIRRMYNLGVLSEIEVNRSYQAIGYDLQNATRLTTFTVKLKQAQEKRAAEAAARKVEAEPKLWTQAQTLKFLKAALITPERAIIELESLGYTPERIRVYLASVQEKMG